MPRGAGDISGGGVGLSFGTSWQQEGFKVTHGEKR